MLGWERQEGLSGHGSVCPSRMRWTQGLTHSRGKGETSNLKAEEGGQLGFRPLAGWVTNLECSGGLWSRSNGVVQSFNQRQ